MQLSAYEIEPKVCGQKPVTTGAYDKHAFYG